MGRIGRSSIGLCAAALGAGLVAAGYGLLRAADHRDAPLLISDRGADIADVYAFRSSTNPDNFVLAMTVAGLTAPEELALSRSAFDPAVLYQFHIDNTGDGLEDLVIQAHVVGPPEHQTMFVSQPVPPLVRAPLAQVVPGQFIAVPVSTGVTPNVVEREGRKYYAGIRDDPFFFDLVRFRAIFIDRTGTGFNPTGTDTFAGTNTSAIVIELPEEELICEVGPLSTVPGCILRIWATTSR